jgi:hypothetical protein
MVAAGLILPCGTSMRVGALHDWPELIKVTPAVMAFCRSASYKVSPSPNAAWDSVLSGDIAQDCGFDCLTVGYALMHAMWFVMTGRQS